MKSSDLEKLVTSTLEEVANAQIKRLEALGFREGAVVKSKHGRRVKISYIHLDHGWEDGKIFYKVEIYGIPESVKVEEYKGFSQMTKPFDLEKAMRNGGKCQTQKGDVWIIFYTDLPGEYKIAAYRQKDPSNVRSFKTDGSFLGIKDSYDLINIPEKKKGWIGHRSVGSCVGGGLRLTTNIYETRERLLEAMSLYNVTDWTIQEIEYEV